MKQIRFRIKYEGRFTYSFGYAIYSAFLESLDEDISEKVHSNRIFTQYMTPSEWVINSEENLPFQESYFLNKYNTRIYLEDQRVREIKEQELADQFLIEKNPRKKIKLSFLTPTTFKQAGEYVLYPTAHLIMQSLTNKWNRWAKRFVLEDMEWTECQITEYNLRSKLYYLKGARVRAFVGDVELSFWGAESMLRLGNMVCDFANYSGTGIKSSLGMGGTRVE